MTDRNGLIAILVWSFAIGSGGAQTVRVSPATMARIGTVDERFQAYNVEMVEVTGGRFWKPYALIQKAATGQTGSTPVGMDPGLYEYRPPIDLSNVRLRKLAAALGPSYVRVSGTWANTVYFHDSDGPAPQNPPDGFGSVLTRKQWKGVIDFAGATDAKIVTSFATGLGVREGAAGTGVWTPEQARRFVQYTKTSGGTIAAAEFMNEPNFAAMGGAPKGYDAAAYGRDVQAFRRFLKEASPGTLFLGPGSVGEGGVLDGAAIPGRLPTEDLLKATGPAFDVFSYHLYGAVSQRCASLGATGQTTAAEARSSEWLARSGTITAYYANLRDRFMPGKPLWNTETADTACGGNPWGSTFLDTFRYLDEHGRLARQGVQVIAHNTLAASDYGLIDEKTLVPRPNYWAALLWRRLMGPVVLDAGVTAPDGLFVYAHCQRNQPGGVALLAINAGFAEQELEIPLAGTRYTLTAKEAQSATVALNGRTLQTAQDGSVPQTEGVPERPGKQRLAPASITFVVFPQAANGSCRK